MIRIPLNKHEIAIVVLLIIMVHLVGTLGVPPVFANFCQVSNVSYNYPQQVMPNQNFRTTVKMSGVCIPDDSYDYSIRVDLSDMSGQILSSNYGSIGYVRLGQNWQVTALNLIAAPLNVGPWQIQFNVYLFANINSGHVIDQKTTKPVTIQVDTSQTTPKVSNMLFG